MFDGKTALLVRGEYGVEWTTMVKACERWKSGVRFDIAQYEAATGEVTWTRLQNFYRRNYEGLMVFLEHEHVDLFVSSDQRLFMVLGFKNRGSGFFAGKAHDVFGFWSQGTVGALSIPASQMTCGVSPGQISAKERQTHRLVSFHKFHKTRAGVATLFPDEIPGEDVESTSLHWSGPSYSFEGSLPQTIVRRNGKICVVSL